MLKLGVIGTNIIIGQMLDTAERTEKYELTAAYSRALEHTGRSGKPYGATGFYGDIDKFFEEGDFDVIYIASPNSLHYQRARKAIENDKFIIIGKPTFVNPSGYSAIESLLAARPKTHLIEVARHICAKIYQAALKKVDEMREHYIRGATITVMKYSSRFDEVLNGSEPYPSIFILKYAGEALMDLSVYAVYGAVTIYGKPESIVYLPALTRIGIDGKGVVILNYGKFTVTLNFGKTTNSHLYSEICGLKDTLVFDSISDTQKVTCYDTNQNAHPIETPVEENSVTDGMNDFTDLFNNPDDEEEMKKYKHWLELSKTVNSVMYSLRQSAQLVFPSDNGQE